MKLFIIGMIVLATAAARAQAGPPHHHMSEEMKVCFAEMKAGSQISENCQALFQKDDERRAKIEACIQQVDAADVSSADTTTNSTGEE